MIIGVDIGYSYTKDSKKHIFPSKVTQIEPVLSDGVNIKINNVDYWVGTGEIMLDLNKGNSILNKLCLLRCLYENVGRIKLVSGLPISQFKNKRDELKSALQSIDGAIYYVDNTKYISSIEDVYIFPQCVATLYTLNNIKHNNIIIDIGSRTVDIAYIINEHNTPKIIKYNTYYDGIYSLYGKIAEEINNKFELTLNVKDIENILSNGLYINGERKELLFLQTVFRNHFTNIFNELIVNYPVNTSDIYLCGGGSELVQTAFKNRFKNTMLVSNSQFSNAIGYEIVGRSYWGEY